MIPNLVDIDGALFPCFFFALHRISSIVSIHIVFISFSFRFSSLRSMSSLLGARSSQFAVRDSQFPFHSSVLHVLMLYCQHMSIAFGAYFVFALTVNFITVFQILNIRYCFCCKEMIFHEKLFLSFWFVSEARQTVTEAEAQCHHNIFNSVQFQYLQIRKTELKSVILRFFFYIVPFSLFLSHFPPPSLLEL